MKSRVGGGEERSVVLWSNTQVRSVLIKEHASNSTLPNETVTINVTSLLKELKQAVTYPLTMDQIGMLVNLLLEEIKRYRTFNLLLPKSKEARYHNICEHLIHNLTDARSIAGLTCELHISTKTFERQFIQLIGISFGKC